MILAIDNQGVVGSLVRGAGSAPGHNAAVAKVWLDFAADSVADWPTRDFLDHLSLMLARWVEPRWPSWIKDSWSLESG